MYEGCACCLLLIYLPSQLPLNLHSMHKNTHTHTQNIDLLQRKLQSFRENILKQCCPIEYKCSVCLYDRKKRKNGLALDMYRDAIYIQGRNLPILLIIIIIISITSTLCCLRRKLHLIIFCFQYLL